jgi:LPS export ABC transporter protein LptC
MRNKINLLLKIPVSNISNCKGFVILALLFSALVILSSCEEKLKPSVMSNMKSNEIPAQESWNSKIIFSDSGITRAILKSDHILYYADKAEYLLQNNVMVDFYNKEGLHNSILTSDSARIDDKTKNMTAYGHVKVVSDSGTVLKTEEMHWTNQTKRISGDKFVTINSRTESIQGIGFESDQNLKDYTIKNVSGQVASENVVK